MGKGQPRSSDGMPAEGSKKLGMKRGEGRRVITRIMCDGIPVQNGRWKYCSRKAISSEKRF